MNTSNQLYRGYRFPSEIISHAALILLLSGQVGATTIKLFGGAAVYGGDIEYGTLTWDVTTGRADFSMDLNPSYATLSIMGFSFNTKVDSSDFSFLIDSDWTYRGLNSPEGIGSDGFDYSLWDLTRDHGMLPAQIGDPCARLILFQNRQDPAVCIS